jgi:hypothetical protein
VDNLPERDIPPRLPNFCIFSPQTLTAGTGYWSGLLPISPHDPSCDSITARPAPRGVGGIDIAEQIRRMSRIRHHPRQQSPGFQRIDSHQSNGLNSTLNSPKTDGAKMTA